jgi:DNA-directed RNA polymerase subunit M/transcription elongation factor TFIIS
MNYCPCCSDLLLPHIRASGTYWFCRSCWQEMPIYEWGSSISLPEAILGRNPQPTANRTSNDSHQRRSINGWIGVQNSPA